jgi:REP element-mobilizing transposase RayT
MPRIARVTSPGYPHHITQRGNNRESVFFDNDDRGFYKSAAIAAALIALVDGMCMHYMILKPEFDVDEICQSFFESLFNGIKRT